MTRAVIISRVSGAAVFGCSRYAGSGQQLLDVQKIYSILEIVFKIFEYGQVNTNEVASRHGFLMKTHKMEIYGICAACRREE
jgi:hypothetical protein